MAEIKEYRLGGAGGYSLHAVGSKTRSGTTYESIFVRRDHREWPIYLDSDQTSCRDSREPGRALPRTDTTIVAG